MELMFLDWYKVHNVSLVTNQSILEVGVVTNIPTF